MSVYVIDVAMGAPMNPREKEGCQTSKYCSNALMGEMMEMIHKCAVMMF